MNTKTLIKSLLNTKDIDILNKIITQNFDQMNHNTFWDILKKEAQKRGLEKKVLQIAKLHLQASKEINGLYYLEFSQELINAHLQGKLQELLKQKESELTKELVSVLLESAQKSMASIGVTTAVPIILEVAEAIIQYCGFKSLKAYLYNQYGIYYLYSNQPQKALESIKKAFNYKIDNEALLDRLQINKGLALYKLGQYNEAIALYKNIEDKTQNIIELKNNLALFYQELGNFSKSLNILNELLEIVDKNNLNQCSKTYGNLANVYGLLGRKEKQREYLILSLRASKSALDRNYEILIVNYFNLTNFYLNQQNFTKGEFWLEIFKKNAKRVQRESDYYFNYALLKIRFFLKRDDFYSARAVIEKVLPNIDKNSSNTEYLSFLVQLGICYLGEKEPSKALEVFEKSIKIAIKTNHNEFIQIIKGYLGICQYILNDEIEAKKNIKAFFTQEHFLREHIGDELNQFYFSIDRENIYHTIIEILIAKNETKLLFEILQKVKSNAINFNSKREISYNNFVEKMKQNTLFIDYYIKESLVFCLIVAKEYKAPLLIKLRSSEDEIFYTLKEYFKTLQFAQQIIYYNPFRFLENLSKKILEPLSQYIENKEQIIISRSSYLNLLPMHIFPYKEGLLFEKVAVSYALNSALVFFEKSSIKNALLISNSLSSDSQKTKKYFEKELNDVAQMLQEKFNVAYFSEDANSKKRLFSTKADIIHLVNHGTFSGKNVLESGMFLKENGKDIFVKLDELFEYKLQTQFIFMSGCSTGEVEPLKGEEPLGIISFLHSNGIKSAILSSWKIPAQLDTIINVIKDFYYFWIKEQLSKSIALQKAMIKNKTLNPYDYAGFILFGESE